MTQAIQDQNSHNDIHSIQDLGSTFTEWTPSSRVKNNIHLDQMEVRRDDHLIISTDIRDSRSRTRQQL